MVFFILMHSTLDGKFYGQYSKKKSKTDIPKVQSETICCLYSLRGSCIKPLFSS